MSLVGHPTTIDWPEIDHLLADQDGVIARAQALALGVRPHDLARLVRRRIWTRVLPGLYLNHTGAPTWQQRAWLGVLHFAPAALSGTSALRAANGPGWRGHGHRDTGPIDIAVPAARNLAPVRGYRVVRTRTLEERVQWNLRPPRVRYEEAVLDLAAGALTDFDAIGVLADACQSRRTTAQRLLDGVATRNRIARRGWVIDVLTDVAHGTCSVLEHSHLTRIERPHGLPRGARQEPAKAEGRSMFRDVAYRAGSLVVELDGRLFHDTSRQRDNDMERDLDVAVGGRDSIRLGWGQCVDRPCQTAGKLALILQARGWRGEPYPCGPDCSLKASTWGL